MGSITFSPLTQGQLTDHYLNEIPQDSRAGKPSTFLKAERITTHLQNTVRALNEVAKARGVSLAQLALAWVLRGSRVTSALIGASKVSQIEHNVQVLDAAPLSAEDLAKIEEILALHVTNS